MAPVVEYEGSSVENAIKKASEELNVPADKLKHDVVSYGSTGIFGLVGTKKARIRVKISDATAPKSEEMNGDPREAVQALVKSTFEDGQHTTTAVEMLAQKSQEALQKIVDSITEDAQVIIKEKTSDQILLCVEGGNSALLIGKRGKTLEALQYLVEKMGGQRGSRRTRIEIDIENYMKKRKEGLLRLASRLAEKAKHTGRPMTVGQMNAHDRRIVHLALKEDRHVRTQSLGDGPNRKLVIFPKKGYARNRKAR